MAMTQDGSRREAFKERRQRWKEPLRRVFAQWGRRGWQVAASVLLMAGLSVAIWSALEGGDWSPGHRSDGARESASGLAGLALDMDDALRQGRTSAVGARVEVESEERPAVSSSLPREGGERHGSSPVATEREDDAGRTGTGVVSEEARHREEADGAARGAVSDNGGEVTGARSVTATGGPSGRDGAPVLQADVRTMLRPGEGALVRERGWYRHPVYGDWRYYPGIEIQMEPGSPVHAALPGVVVFAGEHERWGLTVRIDHGSGWESTYGQLRTVHVHVGDRVDAGQRIGASGLSVAGEPHLYFSLARNGESVDPGRYLDL